jgi:hypothetical protein
MKYIVIYNGHTDEGYISHHVIPDETLVLSCEDVTFINLSDVEEKINSINKTAKHLKGEVSKLLNMTPRTIQNYTDLGLVIPVENPKGRGFKRKYSWSNMYRLLLIQRLKNCGFTLKEIKKLLRGKGGD